MVNRATPHTLLRLEPPAPRVALRTITAEISASHVEPRFIRRPAKMPMLRDGTITTIIITIIISRAHRVGFHFPCRPPGFQYHLRRPM